MVQLSKFNGERKSRQFTAAFRPTTFEALQKIAYIRRMSPNNLLNEAAEQYVADHAELIAQYDEENPKRWLIMLETKIAAVLIVGLIGQKLVNWTKINQLFPNNP